MTISGSVCYMLSVVFLSVAGQRVNGEFVGGSSIRDEPGDQSQVKHHDHTN